MKCPTCQYENDEGAISCDSCGQELIKECLYCKQAIRIQAKFCDRCGQDLRQSKTE
jgi:rRNA maturation endonuclease Nob1